MQKYLTQNEIRDLIINEFRSRGEYVDDIRFDIIHNGLVGCNVRVIPNPFCTHTYNDGSALRKVDGKIICSICGAKYKQIKF